MLCNSLQSGKAETEGDKNMCTLKNIRFKNRGGKMGTDKATKKGRRIKCLVNPTEEEILAQEPLIAFSFYLSGRNNILLSVSDEIIEKFDKGFANDDCGLDCGLIGHASTLMWFWTLGTYEA